MLFHNVERTQFSHPQKAYFYIFHVYPKFPLRLRMRAIARRSMETNQKNRRTIMIHHKYADYVQMFRSTRHLLLERSSAFVRHQNQDSYGQPCRTSNVCQMKRHLLRTSGNQDWVLSSTCITYSIKIKNPTLRTSTHKNMHLTGGKKWSDV